MNFQSRRSMELEPITIILFGRTGSGKSYLGNKLAGKKVFEEGNTLHSKTSFAASHVACLPGFPHILIKIIDTPGFADNRPDMTQEQLLGNIMCFLEQLGDGFHIGIYCVPAKTRADAHDLQEINMIGTLFGKDVFKHTLIAVTQANTLVPEKRKEVYQNFRLYFPNILSIPSIGQDEVLFADGDDQFQKRFVNPLANFAQNASIYQPQIAQDIDPKDPQSIKRALAKPEIQEFMKQHEAMLEEQKKQIVEMKVNLERQLSENQALHQKGLEAQRNHQIQIQRLDEQLNQSQISNKQLEERYRAYRDEQVRKLEIINKQVESQQKKLDRNQQMVDQRDQQINALTKQVHNLETTRTAAAAAAAQPRGGGGGGGFFDKILGPVIGGIAGLVGKSLLRLF